MVDGVAVSFVHYMICTDKIILGVYIMKKGVALLLVLMMLFSLSACGDKEKVEYVPVPSAPVSSVVTKAEETVDFEAEGEQEITDERAKKSVLLETRDKWLEGKTYFAFSQEQRTYEDFVEHIGCDASVYTYSPENNERQFIWNAKENEDARLVATFWESPKGWTLYSIGSTSLW